MLCLFYSGDGSCLMQLLTAGDLVDKGVLQTSWAQLESARELTLWCFAYHRSKKSVISPLDHIQKA